MPDLPQRLTPGPRLGELIKACEKWCVSGCCGIDAFDFSPLHIASHMSAFSGEISEDDIAKLEAEIEILISQANQNSPDENGNICSIDGTNQHFRCQEFDALIKRLRKNIRSATKVLEFSNSLETNE